MKNANKLVVIIEDIQLPHHNKNKSQIQIGRMRNEI